MSNIIDHILQLIDEYPHLLSCGLLSMAAVVISGALSYYGRKAYYSKSEKYQRKYKIAARATAIFFVAIVAGFVCYYEFFG